MARFDSLLKMFFLEDRMVASPDDILHLCNIDYDEMHKKLEKYKREALRPAFLTDNWSCNSQTKGKIRLISTGCSTLWKGLDMMLKTAKELKRLNIDFEWNVCGKMPNDHLMVVEYHEQCTFE